MKATFKRNLIISLIKDDLINTKLINGLIDLGLDASCYYLNLNNTIFQLMGFRLSQRTDELYKKYLDQAQQQIQNLDISQSNITLDTPAIVIYQWLLYEKNNPNK